MSAVLEAREPSALNLESVQPALVRQFELLATAPSGVVRLRELIYILAAGGYLAPKTDSDCMMKLGEVAEFIMGQAPPGAECNKVGEGTVFVKTGEFGVLYPEVCEWTTKPLKFAQTGDVLICVVGATIGKLNLAIDCAIGRSVAAVRPAKALHTKYLYYALMPFTLALRKGSRGSAQGVIGRTDLASIELRVPPRDEQEAIVARIDDLIRLCDTLEAKGRLEAEQHARLLGTLLGTLTDCSTPDELAANWQRVAGHFDLLLDRPEAVDALEQTILQLAVRGLLVPQDPNDLSAHVLLNEVADARVGHIGEVNDGGDGEEADARAAARAFDIPRGWVWATLGQFTQIRGGKRLPAGQSFAVGRTPYGYIQITNMKMGTVQMDHLKYLEPETFAAIKKYTIDQDDLYITIAGTIGQVGEVPPECHGMNLTENAAKLVFRSVDKKWLRFVLSSPFCQSQFIEKTVQQAQPKLALHRIASATVPLPPLAEQQRIVTRVNDLLRICAALRQRLTTIQITQSHLAEALVDEVA